MTTEVQIRKCQSHLTYLRTVVSRIAVGLGMSRKETEEAAGAVNEVCLRSIGKDSSDEDASLLVRLTACDACMTVEITDKHALCSCHYAGDISAQGYYAGVLERVGHLADRVELVREGEATTVLIMKHAGGTDAVSSRPLGYAAALGAAHMQR